jgi:signal transduction histidine kinase
MNAKTHSGLQMSFNAAITPVIDWFIPDDLLADREMRTRARMFLFSHLFGPILGNVIPAYLLWADPKDAVTLAVLAGSICSFWAYPFALKYTDRYALLCFASIQNLIFAILWGCFFYGGLSSPFLPWLVTVPLLAFFYLNASVRNCAMIVLQLVGSLSAFIAVFALGGHFPQTIPLADMQGIGLISIISASIYVSMMALFYARILASQVEFEKEVRKHIETAGQLRLAVSEAERASAAKADFLAKTSHELRTPLNAIIGYSQMLLEDTNPQIDSQGVADLKRIHDAGHQLLRLVNAILDLSKIEAGKMDVFVEPVDVVALLREVVDRWARQIEGRRISLRSEGAPGLVEADAAKLEQVLDALIDNAVCHAALGDVEIVARAPESGPAINSVEISVTDKGPGIAEALVPALFETFNTREDVSASKYGGAGLGLPLCQRLCDLMGASLSMRTAPRVGTTVVVTVPRHRGKARQAERPANDLAAAA